MEAKIRNNLTKGECLCNESFKRREKRSLKKERTISKIKIAAVVLCISIPLVAIAQAGHSLKLKNQERNRNQEKTQIQAVESPKPVEVVKDTTPEVKPPVTPPKQVRTQIKPIPVGDCYAAMKRYFPESQWRIAAAIIRAENGGRPDAVSSTNDHGCFQLNKGLASWGQDVYNADFNARMAYRMYLARGWQPWSAYKNGSYLKYL